MHFRDPESACLYLRNRPLPGQDRLALSKHGFSLRYKDPGAMRAWCDAALVELTEDDSDPQTAALLYGYAGNAHRIVGEFASAERLLRSGIAISPTEPLLLEFFASLLKDTLRLHEAQQVLSRAAELRRSREEPLKQVSTLVQSAIVLDLAGRPSEAVTVVLAALQKLSDQPACAGDALDLCLVALQNLSLYLINDARPAEALQLVRLSRESLVEKGGAIAELKLDWVVAKVAAALEPATARAAFLDVRRRFLELRLLEEVALVSLDLATFLVASSPFEARSEVAFVEPIFREIGIPESSREYQLLRTILALPQPDTRLLLELIEVLTLRKKSGKRGAG